MALLGRLTDAIRRVIREEHLRTWDRNGGPGVVLRVAMRRPLVSAVVIAFALAAVLVVTFGVPPFSPLALIVVVVAPVVPWLRAEQAVHDEWQRRRASESGPAPPSPPEGSQGAEAPDASDAPDAPADTGHDAES
jgi:hypothetical protein